MGAAESVDIQFHSNTNTGVTIQLDKQPQCYIPGETVSGTILIDQSQPRKNAISIDLIGELGYTMNYSTDVNAVRTVYHRLPFFTVSKSSITDGEKFDLRLDQNLPPSVNTERETYPYVRYVLQVNLSKTNKHRQWIIVCPRIVVPHSNIRPIYFDAFNRKQMRLVGSINAEWILPGDRFQIQYKITNPNQELIKHMDGNINMKAKLRGIEYNEKLMDIIIDDVRDTHDEIITGEVPLIFPMRYFPPTFSYVDDMKTFQVNVEYWVTIEVHVNGVLTTMKSTVPLMIGFEPENITFNDVSPTEQPRLSTTSLYTKRASKKHRLHRFSHT